MRGTNCHVAFGVFTGFFDNKSTNIPSGGKWMLNVSYQDIRAESRSVWIWAGHLRLGQHDGLRHDRGNLTPLVGGTGS